MDKPYQENPAWIKAKINNAYGFMLNVTYLFMAIAVSMFIIPVFVSLFASINWGKWFLIASCVMFFMLTVTFLASGINASLFRWLRDGKLKHGSDRKILTAALWIASIGAKEKSVSPS
jgi:type II secretory pathway component PulF